MSYYPPPTNKVFKVYFENGSRFIKYTKDKTIKMVGHKEDATVFFINEYCAPEVMRLRYSIIKSESDATSFKFSGEIKKGQQIKLEECKENDSNFHLKYYLDSDGNLDKIAFIASTKGYYDTDNINTILAFDNYGDERIVWWNIKGQDKYYSIEPKPNQIFKVIKVK